MTKQFKADIFLLLIAAIWGSSFVLMKNVLEHIPAFAYLSLRFLIATVLLVIIFHKRLAKIDKKLILSGVFIGVLLFGGMALQVVGLYYTTASNSAFITGLYVVLVPMLSSIMLKTKPHRFAIIGVFLAMTGIFFLSMADSVFTSGLKSYHFNFGDFLTLLCALCFTLQINFIHKFSTQQDPAALAVVEIGFAALLYTMIWLGGPAQPFQMNWSVVVTLLVTGVLGTVVGFAGQVFVQRHTTPTHTVLIFAAEPMFGALFASLIPNSEGLTEHLKLYPAIGCLLILMGMLISELMPLLYNRRAEEKVGM